MSFLPGIYYQAADLKIEMERVVKTENADHDQNPFCFASTLNITQSPASIPNAKPHFLVMM